MFHKLMGNSKPKGEGSPARRVMKKQRYTWALTGCILGGLTDACLVGILINRYNK